MRDRDAADGPWLAGKLRRRFYSNGGWLTGRAIYPRMIHFREIVIFCREPKNRHRGDAARGELSRHVSRRDGFVDGVSRTGEQSHLLSGHHRYGSGLCQAS